MLSHSYLLPAFVKYFWDNPSEVFSALSVLINFVACVCLFYYTRRTTELRDEARKQSEIQSNVYEASIPPLLMAEFSPPLGTVLLRNVGSGPALSVQFGPINMPTRTIQFDYIAVIAPGDSATLSCTDEGVFDLSAMSILEFRLLLETTECAGIKGEKEGNGMKLFASHYLRSAPASEARTVTARSLSNMVPTFRFNPRLIGENKREVLEYGGHTVEQSPARL